jgi:hypothetical protein
MAQRVDVSAHVRAQRNGFGGRTGAAGVHLFPVFLAQGVQIRRMNGIVGHAGEVWLRQIDCPKTPYRGEKVIDCGHAFSVNCATNRLAMIFIVVDRPTHFFAGLLKALVDFTTSLARFDFSLMQSFFGLAFDLFAGPPRLLASPLLLAL